MGILGTKLESAHLSQFSEKEIQRVINEFDVVAAAKMMNDLQLPGALKARAFNQTYCTT